MPTRTVAIVNPAAGGGRCVRRLRPVLQGLRDGGLKVAVRETHAVGEASTLAATAVHEGFQTVIAVGGDGTLNEVVNGLVPAAAAQGVRTRLGVLPLGTGNSFLRDFSTEGTAHAIEALLADRHRPCDVLRLQHAAGTRLFVNVLGFGFPAEVGAVVDRRLKPLGAFGYVVGVLWQLSRLRHLDLPYRLDQGGVEADPMTFLCVCNSRFTGGTMEMAPAAKIDDSKLDVVRVARTNRATLLRTFPKIFRGTHIHHPAVQATQARSVTLEATAPIAVNLDGEVLTLRPLAIDVLPGAVDVAV